MIPKKKTGDEDEGTGPTTGPTKHRKTGALLRCDVNYSRHRGRQQARRTACAGSGRRYRFRYRYR